jgi:threonine aldolase
MQQWSNCRKPIFENLNRHRFYTIKGNCLHAKKVSRKIVDLRSDTVTAPSPNMLDTVRDAVTGDDVYGEDPTVMDLQDRVAGDCGKEAGLFVPTGTMGNLVSLMAHHRDRATENLMGVMSHISLWEGGNIASLAGVYPRSLPESVQNACFSFDMIRANVRRDDDDHQAETKLLCLENTHNMLGGLAYDPIYLKSIGALAHDELKLGLHLDGARLPNAVVKWNTTFAELCSPFDTVSICLSKGLGAPIGSVVVGSNELIRLAKRARKRCGGGMRQAGVLAAMGLYAWNYNLPRLNDDHHRASSLARALRDAGFDVFPEQHFSDDTDNNIQAANSVAVKPTNIVYFRLPLEAIDLNHTFISRLELEYGVRISGGYSRGIISTSALDITGSWGSQSLRSDTYFRAVTHLDVDDTDVERAVKSIIDLIHHRKQ